MGSGRGASDVGCGGVESNRQELDDVGPVLPVVDGNAEASDEAHTGGDAFSPDELCAPCDEEEQAEMPMCLPSVYQPTRSEYLDHCVTHFPFRAWCRHCLEGRGREFGHERGRGPGDQG